jgi:hypothetical protein
MEAAFENHMKIALGEINLIHGVEFVAGELLNSVREAVGHKARIADHGYKVASMDYDHKRATGVLIVKIEFPITINEEQND